jgi:hypothetical protein
MLDAYKSLRLSSPMPKQDWVERPLSSLFTRRDLRGTALPGPDRG